MTISSHPLLGTRKYIVKHKEKTGTDLQLFVLNVFSKPQKITW